MIATETHTLLVNPHVRRDGFWANIRGHALDLADPSSGQALAPTPDDLFIASIASDVAWFARGFLRDRGVPQAVSVSAMWQTLRDSADIELRVSISKGAAAAATGLATALEARLSALSHANPVVNISFEGCERHQPMRHQ